MATSLRMFLLGSCIFAATILGASAGITNAETRQSNIAVVKRNAPEMTEQETNGTEDKQRKWFPFGSHGMDGSDELGNFQEKFHYNSDSSDMSDGFYKDMDCDSLHQLYEQQFMKLKIENEVCKMKIAFYNELNEECNDHLKEETEEITDLNDQIAQCNADKNALNLSIEAEKGKLEACKNINTDLEDKVKKQQKSNSDLINSNLQIAEQIGFCQDDIYDCQLDVNTCLDSCR